MNSFSKSTYKTHCQTLANKHSYFQEILNEYGFPPMFSRSATFETLVLIILEQQVSLASAKSTFIKLVAKVKIVSPKNILLLSDEELRACSITRQKSSYIKNLALAIKNKTLILENLKHLSNEEVVHELTKIKGIGAWTADVYLMMCLHRSDCFPLGDVALINSAKDVLQLPKETTKQEIEIIANTCKPYRTLAAFMLWWSYINKRKIKWE